MKKLFVASLVCLVVGCAALGVPTAKTFNQKWLAAQVSDTAVLQTVQVLYTAGKLSKADSQNVEAQADNVKSGLDIARSIYATDQKGGTSKLDSVVTALTALQTYLKSKEPKS